MREILNIPTKLLKAYKDDKHEFDLLAAAVLLKIISPNSIVKCKNAAALMKILHCKHCVAQRILDGAKDCELFDYNERKGVLFVRSFKDMSVKEFGRTKKHFKANSDYCKRIEVVKYTMRTIKRKLREALLENAINTKEKQLDSSNSSASSCVTLPSDCAMTQNVLSSSFGLSRSSVSRYTKRMEVDGRVSKSGIVAECAIPVLNDETLAEWMKLNPGKSIHAWHDPKNDGWSGWVYFGCIYTITDRKVSESFRHVIWNHCKRVDTKKTMMVKRKDGVSYEDFVSTPDGEGFWSKFC